MRNNYEFDYNWLTGEPKQFNHDKCVYYSEFTKLTSTGLFTTGTYVSPCLSCTRFPRPIYHDNYKEILDGN